MNKEEIPQNKKYMGYKIRDNEILLTNEKVFKELGITEDQLQKFYNQYKEGLKYSKAVKVFNTVYSNDLVLNSYQEILKDSLNNPTYDITLVFYDTCLLYDKLKDNTELVAMKESTKLYTEGINLKTDFLKWCSYVELGLKNFSTVDKTTQNQILALVIQTIRESEIIENIQYLWIICFYVSCVLEFIPEHTQ